MQRPNRACVYNMYLWLCLCLWVWLWLCCACMCVCVYVFVCDWFDLRLEMLQRKTSTAGAEAKQREAHEAGGTGRNQQGM